MSHLFVQWCIVLLHPPCAHQPYLSPPALHCLVRGTGGLTEKGEGWQGGLKGQSKEHELSGRCRFLCSISISNLPIDKPFQLVHFYYNLELVQHTLVCLISNTTDLTDYTSPTPPSHLCSISSSRHLCSVTFHHCLQHQHCWLPVQASIQAPADALPCSLQQEVDMSSLKEIDAVPFLPSPKGAWSPVVKPFSLVPAYLVAGSANNTARAVLSLENTQGIDHSVQVVTNCYNESRSGSIQQVLLHSSACIACMCIVCQRIRRS